MNNTTHEGQVDHRHFNEQPYKVKLIRGMKGNYGWEISISGSGLGDIETRLEMVNASMKVMYGSGENKEVKE